MKIIRTFVLISTIFLWSSVANACHEDRLQAIGQNVYLMSKPNKNSRVISKVPTNYNDLKGCVNGNLGKDYKVDRQGNRWYYVGLELNNKRINGWVMAKKTKVILSCCQSG
jgi:hypothetical protein